MMRDSKSDGKKPIKEIQGLRAHKSKLERVSSDITEHKKTQEALQESEERYRALVGNIPGMVYRGRPDWSVDVISNPEKICGYNVEEFTSQKVNWAEIIHPDDRERVLADASKIEKESTSTIQEYRIIAKDGTVRWIEDHKVSIITDTGVFIGVDGVVFDITERKRAEEALRKSEERYRTLFESSLDGIATANLNGTITDCNRAYAQMLGYSSEELKKIRYQDITPSKWHALNEKMFLQVMKRGSSDVFEKEYIRKDGTVFPVSLHAWRIDDEDGNAIGVGSIVRDITERKKAEEQLKQSKEFLDNIIDALDDPVFVKDEQHRWVVLNDGACKVMGRPREELIGKSDYDLFPKEQADVFWEKDNLVLETGETNVNEEEITWHGKLHTISTKKSLLTDHLTGQKLIAGSIRDVTEEKRLEEALRESEKTARAILNATQDLAFLIDSKGTLLALNETFAKRFGKHNDELVGSCVYDLLQPDIAQKRKAEARKVIRSGRPGRFEDDREGKYFDNSVYPVFDTQGKVERLAVFSSDITERKKAEVALRESEQKYRALVEQSLQGIVILQDFRIVFANAAAAQIARLMIEQLMALSLEEMMSFIPPEDRASVLERLKNRLAGRTAPENYELRLVHKNGESFWLNMFFSPVEYQGKFAIQAILVDITEHKRVEEALHRSEKRFRDFFENTAVGVYRTTPDGQILMANPALVRMLEYSSFEELSQRNLEEEGFEPQYSRSIFKEEIEHKGRIVSWESIWTTRDGNKLHVIENARAVKDENGKILYYEGTAENITERKQAEEKLLVYQDQLKSLASQLTLAEERERRRIATELHDEISQSLFISKMKVEALRKSMSGKEFNETLDEISNSLGRMIANMRSLTFDLSSPVLYELGFEEAVAEWLTEQIEKKYGIATEFEDDGLAKTLDDDIRVLLFRNVRELLINAIKHARAKKIKVSIQKVDRRIRVSVEDDGVGFDATKAETMITNKEAFGLFSIRERLEHFGGELEIASAPGRGCKVTITSPLRKEKIIGDRQG